MRDMLLAHTDRCELDFPLASTGTASAASNINTPNTARSSVSVKACLQRAECFRDSGRFSRRNPFSELRCVGTRIPNFITWVSIFVGIGGWISRELEIGQGYSVDVRHRPVTVDHLTQSIVIHMLD